MLALPGNCCVTAVVMVRPLSRFTTAMLNANTAVWPCAAAGNNVKLLGSHSWIVASTLTTGAGACVLLRAAGTLAEDALQ